MTQDPQNVEYNELATLRWSSPKPGRHYGGPIKGEVQLEAVVPKDIALLFHDKLRRVGSGRSGLIRVYLDDEELHLESKEGGSFQPEELEFSAPAATLTGDAAVLAGQRTDLARLDKQILEAQTTLAGLKERVSKAEQQAEARIALAEDRARERITKATEHADAQISRFYQLDAQTQDFRVNSLDTLQLSMAKIVETRKRSDELIGADSWTSFFKEIKETVTSTMDSPVGQAVSLQLSAFMAQISTKVAGLRKDDGSEFTAKDALAAMVMQGREWRDRKAVINRTAANAPHSVVARAAALAIQIADGDAEPKALHDMILAHEAAQAAGGGA